MVKAAEIPVDRDCYSSEVASEGGESPGPGVRHCPLLDSKQADAKSWQQPSHSKTALELVKLLQQCHQHLLCTAHFAGKIGKQSLKSVSVNSPILFQPDSMQPDGVQPPLCVE